MKTSVVMKKTMTVSVADRETVKTWYVPSVSKTAWVLLTPWLATGVVML
jgi:hypothetical protein